MKRIILMFLLGIAFKISAQESNRPIMGWSSWNNFRVNINEQLLKEQADAMISSGLYNAGYRFINIDDGYFGGRDSSGTLYIDSTKFPSGMKALADYIHSKGLKAGIYSDAGRNTCGSIWDNDKNGIGVGLYGHLKEDCDLFFNQWGYDFLKVDWCGGEKMKLDKQTEYLKIIKEVRSVKEDVVFNICCWTFPGQWAIKQADSWRVSGDIDNTFTSICKIIDINAGLGKYSSPGHFNDMDMLQVGRGMSYDEDKAHFSMWCMLGSPLLAGNDLRKMTKQTIEILTNKEIIELNQDTASVQAKRIFSKKKVEVWLKPLSDKNGKNKAVVILNRGEKPVKYFLTRKLTSNLSSASVRDLWLHKEIGKIGKGLAFNIPKHGVVVVKLTEK